MQNEDMVVLVHGLGGSRLDMWPIARRLGKSGFQTKSWGYRSIGKSIEMHANCLADLLTKIDQELRNSRFHLVTHSMGGIIARAVFAKTPFKNLGRVVMLAPPHAGSHAARKLNRYVGWLTPSLGQLSDEPESFVNNLPNSLKQNGIEFGIVESSKDRVIAPGAVLLNGYQDYASVAGHHGVLTWYSDTIQLVENFITNGTFSALESGRPNRSMSGSADKKLKLEGS